MTTALITGASSGIGLDLAKLFAADGHRLVLVARNEAALGALAADLTAKHNVSVEVLPKDLAAPTAAQEIADELARRSLSIDYLVNNAGFGSHGPFAEADLASQISMVQVNVTALLALTRLLLPPMLARRSGRILNVGSTAGFVPGPYMATYYATKAFVLSHSVALAYELRRTGVTVTTLCPGPTRTEFQTRAGVEKSKLFRLKVMDSPTVALAGYQGMLRGKLIVVPGMTNRLVTAASRFAPRRTLARVAGKLNNAR